MALQLYKIAAVEVGSAGASSIDFTSIPQGYTDLKLVTSIRGDRTAVDTEALIKFNSSTTSYSYRLVGGNGSATTNASASTYPPIVINAASSTSSAFSSGEVYIPNYTSSSNKSISADSASETNATAANLYLVAGLWSNSAAITSITLTPFSNNFGQYSTATLYGIL